MPTISKKKRPLPEKQEGYVSESCGNVFAELGLHDPEIHFEKAKLTMRLRQAIEDRKLSILKAAKLLGLPTKFLKDLLCGSASKYSIDRLLRFLADFGHTFEIILRPIVVKPETNSSGRDSQGSEAEV